MNNDTMRTFKVGDLVRCIAPGGISDMDGIYMVEQVFVWGGDPYIRIKGSLWHPSRFSFTKEHYLQLFKKLYYGNL